MKKLVQFIGLACVCATAVLPALAQTDTTRRTAQPTTTTPGTTMPSTTRPSTTTPTYQTPERVVYRDRELPKGRFGIKGGLNLSNLYINQVGGESSKVGFNAGIYYKAPLGKLFSIQPELLYTVAGTRIDSYNNALALGGKQVNFNLNYVQLPLLFVATLGPIHVQFGPYASYLLGANVKNIQLDTKGLPSVTSGRELTRSDFHTMDYGLVGGLAFEIRGIQLGARYNYGLREVGKGAITNVIANNAKNSVAQFYVGIGF